MKKKLIALFVLLCMVIALSPVSVFGANVFEFKYYNDDPETGVRVGIKSIVIDDVTYYDLYNGDPNVRIAPNQSIPFIRDVLTKPDNTVPGDVTALDYWAQLAYRVFKDNSAYASHINASGGFETNFGKRGGGTDGGYADLVQDLQRLSSGERWNTGSNSSDNTRWTGLAYASSLQDVRQRMANSIAAGIGRKISGQQVLDNTDDGDALAMLDDDKTNDVFYSIVTGVDRVGATYQFYYNSFGIAFYDFQLSVIADNGLQYITAAEGYESVKDAADNQAPGVTYEVLGNSSGMLSYYENRASIQSDVGMEFSQSNSTEVSNSMTSTETYSFRETIGSETMFLATVPLLGGVEETIKLEFSAEQAFSTAWTETKTVKQESANKVSATLSLPAHSVVSMNSADGTVKVTLQYDGPVAISYKVAMFALNGCCYDDNMAIRKFDTAGYVQGHFCSVFGGGAVNDARTDFYNRMFNFKDITGYDESLKATLGWWDKRGDGRSANEVRAINWNSILGNIEEETLAVGYTRECYEVELAIIGKDEEDNDIYAYVLKSPLNKIYTDSRDDGIAWYENRIAAPGGSPVAGYTLVSDDVWQLVNGEYEPVENVLLEGENAKIIRFYDDPADNVISFYYVADTGRRSIDGSAGSSGGDSGDSPVGASNQIDNGGGIMALSSTFDTMADTTTLANWLGKHAPMSSVGGVLTFISQSMNTEIQDVIALYPLKNVVLKEGLANVYNMIEGDVLEINGLEVEGFNSSTVPYFGFNQKFGQWVLVDENDNILTNSDIASLSVTPQTGRIILTAGGEEGVVYLKYLIDENKYTSYTVPSLATNDSLTRTAYVQINTTAKPFSGSLGANGSIIGYEGESLNLLSLLSSAKSPAVYVFDDMGKEISAAVTWEKKYVNGLSINGNELSFDQASDDNDWIIWAEYRGKRSPDIPVKVLPARKLQEITISDTKRLPPLLEDYILGDGADTFDLAQWLNIDAKDQYDDNWPIDANDADWFYEYMSPEGALMSDQLPAGVLTVAGAGVYEIWAGKDGALSNKLTLNVLPARKLQEITISDTKRLPPLLGDYILGDGTDTFDLAQWLNINAKDQYDDNWPIDANDADWYYEYMSPEGALMSDKLPAGVLTVAGTGVYEIWAGKGGALSNKLTLNVLPARKLQEITISDTKRLPPLLDDYILGDGTDAFDLAQWLNINAKDQYDDNWPIDANDADWYYEYMSPEGALMSDQLPAGVLTVAGAGAYEIWAGKDGALSNKLTLNVQPAADVASITISGSIPLLDVDPNRSGHSYDLSLLTIEALDQYGRVIDIPGAVWDIPNGAQYAAIANNLITGYVSGSGTVRLMCGGVFSNALPFDVGAAAYVKELYYAENADNVTEGVAYDLSNVLLTAKDQWGEPYALTKNQIDSIVWKISNDPSGTVTAADMTLTGSMLEVKTGAVAYAGTGTVILTAVLPDRGDGLATEALFVMLYVRQAPLPAELTIGLAADTELREGENMLVSGFFTVSALDQYDEDYPLATDDVLWSSDNTGAFRFSAVNGSLAIFAVAENESADITASIAVNKYGLVPTDYKIVTPDTVVSNAIRLSVPMPRRVKSISAAGAPNVVEFGSTFNVNNLVSTVFDEINIPFTDVELEAYPATIRYSIEAGGTGSIFDAATGLINFGHTRGTVELIAMVVNSSNAQLASSVVKIAVEPAIFTVTFNLNNGRRTGGGELIQTVPAGGTAIAPTADRSGYTFNGWDRDFSNITADMTVTARWSGGSNGSGSSGGGSGVGSLTATTPSIIEEPEIPLAAPFPAFIVGFEDNSFRGDTLITREQFVTILFRLKNALPLPQADKNSPSFKDVKPDRWSYDAIEWALKEGIATTNTLGNFRPEEALTRAEMAVMLIKAEKLTEIAENIFNDLDEHPDRDDILRAVAANIFDGYPDGSFKPEGNTTRNEAVTALVRYLLGGEPTNEMWEQLSLSFSDVPRSHWAYKYIVLAVRGYAGM